jgi:hypothetical protein
MIDIDHIVSFLEATKYFVWLGKVIGKVAGGRKKDPEILKEISIRKYIVQECNVICEIDSKNRVVRIDRIILKAETDDLKEYKFGVGKTWAKNIAVSLIEGGKMDLPQGLNKQEDNYIIHLNKSLKIGEYSDEIITKWDIEDLTGAPFLHEFYGGAKSIRNAKYTVIFPENHIKNIQSSKKHSISGRQFGETPLKIYPFPFFASPKQCVFWEIGEGTVEKTDSNLIYQIDWQWANNGQRIS